MVQDKTREPIGPGAATSTDSGGQLAGGGALSRELKGLSYEEQLERLRPPESGGPPGAADGPVAEAGEAGAAYALSSQRLSAIPLCVQVMGGQGLMRAGCGDRLAVAAIQGALGVLGFDPGVVDGLWGSMTNAAVYGYQAARGLMADAIIGPKTLGSLDQSLVAEDPVGLPGGVEGLLVGLGLGGGGGAAAGAPADQVGATSKLVGDEVAAGGGGGGSAGGTQKKGEPPVDAAAAAQIAAYEKMYANLLANPNIAQAQATIAAMRAMGVKLPPGQPANNAEALAWLLRAVEHSWEATFVGEFGARPDSILESNRVLNYLTTGQFGNILPPGEKKALEAKWSTSTLDAIRKDKARLSNANGTVLAWQTIRQTRNMADAMSETEKSGTPVQKGQSSKRAAIGSYALSYVGRVAERKGSGRVQRVGSADYEIAEGGELLEQIWRGGATAGYFARNDGWGTVGQHSAGGIKLLPPAAHPTVSGARTKPKTSYTGGDQIGEWCGIFANFVYLSAGVPSGGWDQGGGATGWFSGAWPAHPAAEVMAGKYAPKPGDLAYFAGANQHQAIIVRTDGNSLWTVDGNSGTDPNSPDATVGGRIVTHQRALASVVTVYEMPG